MSFDTTLLCAVGGRREDEQHIHRQFAKHRVENEEETYRPHPEVVDYVRWLRDQHFVLVPDDERCPQLNDLEPVEASAWMPVAGRSKPQARREQGELSFDCRGVLDVLDLPARIVTIDDFYTDPSIIEAARLALGGGIDLDPASHAFANQVVQADRFYTARDDGLQQPWHGRVWLNPPFSDWKNWVVKIAQEWQSGHVQTMCILCATRTLTAQYFAWMHEHCAALCVLRGRIPFWGDRAGSPDDGHAVFYFGSDVPAFRLAFADIGHFYQRGKQP